MSICQILYYILHNTEMQYITKSLYIIMLILLAFLLNQSMHVSGALYVFCIVHYTIYLFVLLENF